MSQNVYLFNKNDTLQKEGILMMTKKVVNLEKIAELLKVDIKRMHQQLAKISSASKNECKQ